MKTMIDADKLIEKLNKQIVYSMQHSHSSFIEGNKDMAIFYHGQYSALVEVLNDVCKMIIDERGI